MRRDQTRAPEPLRSTFPNTDQPRIPHSEYHYTRSKAPKLRSSIRKNVVHLFIVARARTVEENIPGSFYDTYCQQLLCTTHISLSPIPSSLPSFIETRIMQFCKMVPGTTT